MNLTKEEIEVINSLPGDKCLVMTLIYRYIFTYYNRERVYTTNPEALPPDVLRERYYKKELAAWRPQSQKSSFRYAPVVLLAYSKIVSEFYDSTKIDISRFLKASDELYTPNVPLLKVRLAENVSGMDTVTMTTSLLLFVIFLCLLNT